MLPLPPHGRPRGATFSPLLLVLQLFVLVAVLLCEPTAAFQPSSPLSPSGTTSSSIQQQRVRSRGDVVCKKGSSSSSSGPPASKGFGFGAKPKADKYKYSGRLKPGVLSPTREVPEEIMRPDYALDGYVIGACVCVCRRVLVLKREMLESMCVRPTSSLRLEGGQARLSSSLLSVVLSLISPLLFFTYSLPFTHPHCNRFLMHLLIPHYYIF